MANNSQLGWVLAVGGLGIAGFYVFKKQKPTIATEQLQSITADLANIKAKSEAPSTTSAQMAINDAKTMTAIELDNLINKDWSKVDFSKIQLNSLSMATSLLGNSYEKALIEMDYRVSKEFPLPYPLDGIVDFKSLLNPPKVDAYSCIKLDVLLRDITLKIDSEQQKVIARKAGNDQLYVNGLQRRKASIQSIYDNNACTIKIEDLRLSESAMLLTKGAIIQENKVSTKSNTDQQIYIGVGALVVITGLYMILKK